MILLVLSACLLSAPATCHPTVAGVYATMAVCADAMVGEAEVWAREHPGLRVDAAVCVERVR